MNLPRSLRLRADRLTPAVAASIAGVVFVCLALALLEIDQDLGVDQGRLNLQLLRPLWIASAIAWCGLSLLLIHLVRLRSRESGSDARGRRTRRTVVLIVAVALAARCVVVFTHEPALSDDIWRYVYDGRNLANGINPYLPLPDHSEDLVPAEERWTGEAAVAGRINHGELHTIYLPTSQIIFALGGFLCETVLTDPSDPAANALVFQSIFAAIDLAVIVLILAALRTTGRSPWWAALYAWHPLPLIEFAGSGHLDVAGIALMFGVIFLVTNRRGGRRDGEIERRRDEVELNHRIAKPPNHKIDQERKNPSSTDRRAKQRAADRLWPAVLALAGLVKPVAVLLGVFLLRGRPNRAWIRAVLIGGVLSIALLAPFLLAKGAEPLANYFSTAERFTLKWAHFGSAYKPLLWAIEQLTNDPDAPGVWQSPDLWTNDDQERLARGICIGLLLIAGFILWLRVRDVWRACQWFLFAMLLLTPAAHPWYLLWSLVFIPIRPSISIWVASLTILWGYAAWGYTSRGGELVWGAPTWVMALSWAPVYAALVVDCILYLTQRNTEKHRGVENR